MERAFVTGATGYTGREVVKELVGRDVEVLAHVRPDSPRLEHWRKHFTEIGATFDCTPWGQPEFEAVMRHYRPTYVFGLLGTTQKRARRARRQGANDSYETVDYGLTAIALKATVLRSPGAKFIYLSAIGVREGTRNPYMAARARLESDLKATGLKYVIARPALITGDDREEFRLGERLAANAVAGLFGFVKLVGLRSITDRYATLSGGQLARGLVNAALDPACMNATLEPPQLLEYAAQ